MIRIFLISILLFTSAISQEEYPKMFAQLGTPLYKADAVFSKFSSFEKVSEKAQPYHAHVQELLSLANKIEKASKPDKQDKKAYINGLRTLQKEHDDIIRSINGYLLQTIDADDYEGFTRIINTGGGPILENRVILKRAMAFYVAYRTRGKIDVLDTHFETLSSDTELMEYVKGHMPTVHLLNQGYNAEGESHKLLLSNNEHYAFIADGSHCFKSIDIKNFANASEVASFDFSSTGCSLVDISQSSDGNFLYLSDVKNGYTILDISQPKAPLQKDSYTKIRATASITSADGITSFVVRKEKGLTIIDIYNKDEFRLLANYNRGVKINQLDLDDNRSRLYLAHSEGVSVLDISTLGNPRELLNFPLETGADDLILSPDKQIAYVASKDAGIHVLDLSQDNNISLISTCLTPAQVHTFTLSKDGERLYASALEDGVYYINTTDKKDMKHVSTYKSTKKDALALSSTLNKAEDALFISFEKAGIGKIKLNDSN